MFHTWNNHLKYPSLSSGDDKSMANLKLIHNFSKYAQQPEKWMVFWNGYLQLDATFSKFREPTWGYVSWCMIYHQLSHPSL